MSAGKEILVREHRGSLADSMATVQRVKDKDALVRLIHSQLSHFGVNVAFKQVKITPYAYDDRIGWNTYLITIDGYGVWGMADGPVK